jgi:hypothetical protein
MKSTLRQLAGAVNSNAAGGQKGSAFTSNVEGMGRAQYSLVKASQTVIPAKAETWQIGL